MFSGSVCSTSACSSGWLGAVIFWKEFNEKKLELSSMMGGSLDDVTGWGSVGGVGAVSICAIGDDVGFSSLTVREKAHDSTT